MKKHKYSLLIISLLLEIILFGCSGANVGGVKDANGIENQNKDDAQIDNVRVSTFILGIGDSIEIVVYRQDDLKKNIKIDPSGKIMFPLIGDMQAAGEDVFVLRDEIKERLSKYLVDPQVTISVTTVQSQKIMVLGEVKSPGIFTLDSDITALDAISKAGGMTNDAKLGNVLLIKRERGKPKVTSLDLKRAFKKGDLSQNRMLQNGDIVYVPAVAVADVSWFFSHLSKILSPIVSLESGIVLWPQVQDVFQGGKASTGLSIPTN